MHCSAEELYELLRLDLYEAGWKDSETPESDHRQRAMSSLAKSFLKKFHDDVTDEKRDSAALALFLECNQRCRDFTGVVPRRLNEELVINEMKSIIYDFFNPIFRTEGNSLFREPHLLNLSAIASSFSLGSGSNIGASSTDFYTKLVNSTMSHTNEVLPLLYRQAVSVDKIWAGVEAFRSQKFQYKTVSGSRLSFVPKSRVISRTICTEPVLNMLFQRGIGIVMEKRLKEVFQLDLTSQPTKNANLARLGSLTGDFGTIDLSSASDSISINLLRDILPAEPLTWLMRCRSPFTTLPSGEVLELHMISSMGNGFTFPLQTMIFASLVMAAYRVYGIKVHKPYGLTHGNFAVFGDDIIVHKNVYNVVVSCLEVLGFRVNHDKSFNTGLFRESCGSDFYSGHNIRGVYLQRLNTSGDFYSAINRLNRWSSAHGIFLTRTVGRLRDGCRFIGVPYDEADDAGIKVPFALLRSPRRDINGATKYVAHVNTPRRVRVPSVGLDAEIDQKHLHKIRRCLPNFEYNADGLLLCLLAGWLRNGSLGLRSLSPKAVLRRRVCPGWDESIAARGVSPEVGERWKAYTTANLVS